MVVLMNGAMLPLKSEPQSGAWTVGVPQSVCWHLGVVPDPLLDEGAADERAHQPDRDALQLRIICQLLAEVPAAGNVCRYARENRLATQRVCQRVKASRW